MLEVDEERGCPGDVVLVSRRAGAKVADQLLCGGVLRRADRSDVDRRHIAGQPLLDGYRGHPGQLPDMFGVRTDAGVAYWHSGHDLDGVGLGAGEVRGEQVVHGTTLEGGGQGAGVTVG